MDESFEQRPLLDRDTLRTLQQRQDILSLVRLTLHLGAFLSCAWVVIVLSPYPCYCDFLYKLTRLVQSFNITCDIWRASRIKQAEGYEPSTLSDWWHHNVVFYVALGCSRYYLGRYARLCDSIWKWRSALHLLQTSTVSSHSRGFHHPASFRTIQHCCRDTG